MKKKKGIAGAMLSVSGVVILGKIMGFVKQMITANAFGATLHTDIISLSQGIVSDLDYIIAQALITAFIPTYIHIKTKEEGQEKTFVSNTILVFLVSATVLSILLVVLSDFLSRIIAPSYGPVESKELAKYIRIIAPLLTLIVQLAIFNALLKANEHFTPGELTGFNQSIILIILVFFVGSTVGPDTLVIGFYICSAFNLVYLMFFSRHLWSISRTNPFSDRNVKQLLLMMGPLLLGYSMVFINQQVDKIIVSGLGDGMVTAMSYAAVLSNFIGTFIGSISGVLFTYVTENIAKKRDETAANLINRASIQMITLLLPICILIIMNAEDIVAIVFGRGKFSVDAVHNCSLALMGYGFMFVPYVIRELFSRFQYGYGDSKKPMINSSIAIACNIVLSIILSKFLGVLGVTLATSISVLVCAILNILSSKKKNKHINLGTIIKQVPKWIAGGIICAVISILGHTYLNETHILLRVSVIVSVSITGYLLITHSVIQPLVKQVFGRK